jgi:hypothetical protein
MRKAAKEVILLNFPELSTTEALERMIGLVSRIEERL